MRYALITDTERTSLATVERYLPANYDAWQTRAGIIIQGVDRFGWGMDTYVLPRLASGLIFAKEITKGEVATLTLGEV